VSVAKRVFVSLGLVKKLIQQRRHLGEIAPLHWRTGRKTLFTTGHKGPDAGGHSPSTGYDLGEVSGVAGIRLFLAHHPPGSRPDGYDIYT